MEDVWKNMKEGPGDVDLNDKFIRHEKVTFRDSDTGESFTISFRELVKVEDVRILRYSFKGLIKKGDRPVKPVEGSYSPQTKIGMYRVGSFRDGMDESARRACERLIQRINQQAHDNDVLLNGLNEKK